jgi:hypothetical protein
MPIDEFELLHVREARMPAWSRPRQSPSLRWVVIGLLALLLSLTLLLGFGIFRGSSVRLLYSSIAKPSESETPHVEVSEVSYYGRSPPVYPCRKCRSCFHRRWFVRSLLLGD